jgi:hypothetical protein
VEVEGLMFGSSVCLVGDVAEDDVCEETARLQRGEGKKKEAGFLNTINTP